MTSHPGSPNAPGPATSGLSRRGIVMVGLCVWLVGIPLAHGVMPWVISLLATRHGWQVGRPGPWNLVGLFPLALGVACLAWVGVTGFSRVSEFPARVKLGLTPVILLTSGPFAFSRNPMYLSALTLWIGWAIFYGSLVIAALWPGMWVVVRFLFVPREERSLERCFGDQYLRYKREVPRWLGGTKRPSGQPGSIE